MSQILFKVDMNTILMLITKSMSPVNEIRLDNMFDLNKVFWCVDEPASDA